MKVSVLSAVHNEERYVLDMVESVRDQTHEDWELLLVDDGSTDATGVRLDQAAASDPRVKKLGDGAKRGKVAAFNEAFAAAGGDVIVLLGGDDLLTPDSLAVRAGALQGRPPTDRVAASFKLQTLSDSLAHDGMVLPKGDATSKSGGVIAMTRGLAEVIFPIDPTLPSEDLWIGELIGELASELVSVPHVVLHYRIHAGNSNPRSKPFTEMTAAMHARHRAWSALLEEQRFDLSPGLTTRLGHLAAMESLRHEGRVLKLLAYRSMPLPDRLGLAAMASPALWAVRKRFFRLLSGLRGQ
ncbi:glycosyltransferase family 2 protein [Intrasporangium sp. YIM S08009]|uniref:glycosyltransferase family 2 protein n=1 Tax=Intrasporangium zincisolvens TaxID=3080018 RepID=UPI002B060132|nr:glycosyltransferase family 2 protein [Intrasporangium sp. YIM S08009]